MKTLKILILTFLFLTIVILSIGGGHGTYLIAKIIFPFSMLLALAFNEIGLLSILFAVLQIPIYWYFLESKPKSKYFIIGLHIFTAIICLLIKSETF